MNRGEMPPLPSMPAPDHSGAEVLTPPTHSREPEMMSPEVPASVAPVITPQAAAMIPPPNLGAPKPGNHRVVGAPKASRQSVEVVAIGPGFYAGHRRSLGDKFMVKDFSDLGRWMKCTDPVMEKKRVEMLEAKRQQLRGV